MNPLRHILVHVDSAGHSLERLRIAQTIAAPSSAHITGLYAVTPWLLRYPASLNGEAGVVLASLDADKLARTKAQFQEASAGIPHVHWADKELSSPYEFADRALCADLLILGQSPPSHPHHVEREVPGDFVPSVILNSGKPAIIVPAEGSHLQTPVQSVLIAWNSSRESARALTAALSMLPKNAAVHVAMFDDPGGREQGCSVQLERYLQWHDFKATFYMGHAPSSNAGSSLLTLAQELKCDLLVMGCYGHSRAREWALGGATRAVLQNMRLPVLMAH